MIVIRVLGVTEFLQNKFSDSGVHKRVQPLPPLLSNPIITITLKLLVTQDRLFFGKTFPWPF